MPTAFPLSWPEGWPRTLASQRSTSRFRTRYADAYDNLVRQLTLMGATQVVISSNAPLRRDGRPYTEAMEDDIADPGVAVYFRVGRDDRAMARDGHPTPAENLHAIGHVIEALRSIERHGGSFMMRRAFSGFAALPAPASRPWHEVLGVSPTASTAEIREAHRTLIARHHPDNGGSVDVAAEINAARDAALKERGA